MEERTNCTLGQRLFFLRKSNNLTLQILSDDTGISRSNLSKYEKNAVKPTSDVIISLCKFYGISSDWLLYGKKQIGNPCKLSKNDTACDPDLKRMTNILKELMESKDPNIRGWTIVQFEMAFKQQCSIYDEKNYMHNSDVSY